MSTMKRFLSLALALMMVITMMPTTAFATDDVTEPVAPETTVPETHEHVWGEVTGSTATCVADGIGTQACECGATQEVTVSATGHAYADGVCSVCGEAAPTEPVAQIDEVAKPNAAVTVLDPVILTAEEHDYMVWPSGDDTVDRPLQIVMNFKANDTLEEAKAGGFGKYLCDFYLKFDGIENNSVVADGCYLAGNYGTFGWIVIPTDGLEVENGVAYPVVANYDATLNYEDICGSVKDFTAAIYITPEILNANPDFKVELALKMTNPDDETDVLVIGEPAVYDVEDLSNPEYPAKPPVSVDKDLSEKASEEVKEIIAEVQNNTALQNYVPENVPAEASLKIKLVEVSAENDTLVFDVAPMKGSEKVIPASEIVFRLPVPDSFVYAKVLHEGVEFATVKVQGETGAKYVELSSKDFSKYSVQDMDVVAEVGTTPYTDIQEAIKAAAPSGTVELLSSVTVDKWVMISETLSIGDGTIINLEMAGLTINGNGHTLTINDVESAGNGNHIFYDGDFNICDLTIKMGDNVNGIGITSGTIKDVIFFGGRGASGGAAIHVADGKVTGVHAGKVTIEGCTFQNNGGAIYFETAQNELEVKKNTFNLASGANVILLYGTEKFTDNTVISGRTVNVVSGSPVVTGNDFGDVRLKVYNEATATISENTINNLVFNDETTAQNSTFAENTLSENAQAKLDAVTPDYVAQVGDIKYETLQEAFKAATSGCTIEILSDVTVEGKWDCRANGAKFTVPVTIDGNSHTLKIVGEIDDGYNYLAAFRFEAAATVMDLTIDMSEAVSVFQNCFSAISAKGDLIVKNCEFIGSTTYPKARAIIFGEGTDEGAQKVSLTVSTFTNWLYGVVDNMNGKDTASELTVQGNTFTNANVNVSADEKVTFAGNTVADGSYVKITAYSGLVDVTANGNTMSEHVETSVSNAVNFDNVQNEFQIIASVTVTSNGVTKPFSTLQAAIDAANAGDKVTVLKDIALTEGVTVPAGKTITLDLNGKTISYESTKGAADQLIANKGKLTIDSSVDGGKITFEATNPTGNAIPGYASNTITNAGELVINDGYIENTTAGTAAYVVDLNNTTANTSLTVNGGSLVQTQTGYSGAIRLFANSQTNTNSVTIKGGEVTGRRAIWIQLPGSNQQKKLAELNITGGTVTSNDSSRDLAIYVFSYGDSFSGVKMNISGGVIDGNIEFKDSIATAENNSPIPVGDKLAEFAITGGTFYGKITNATASNTDGLSIGKSITGGSFSDHISLYKYLSDDCKAEYNVATGMFVVEAAPVAIVNNVIYTSLAEAIKAAKNGSEIVLQRDIKLTDTLVIPAGYNVILNMNGKTISQSKSCTSAYSMIENKGSLTITGNGKISFTDTGAGDPNFTWGAYTLNNAGTLVVENGTIENLSAQNVPGDVKHMYCAIQQFDGTVTINGGTISTPTYRSVRVTKGTLTINGGTFEGQVWVQPFADGIELDIKGGNFAPSPGDASSVFVTNNSKDVAMSVTGGTFEGKIGASVPANLAGAISGGFFTEDAMNGTNAAMLATDLVFASEADANGYFGLVDDPYYISNLKELKAFRDDVNAGNTYAGKTVTLGADIDLNNEEWTPIGYMDKTFKGTFDGNDKTISNLKISKTTTNSAENNGIGLFGRTDDTAVIKNLTIENVDITGSLYVGAVVGFGYTGKLIENVTVKGDIAIDAYWYAGGIGGNGYLSTVNNCHVIGKEGSYIKGNNGSYIGGIWGFRGEGDNKITNCTVSGLDITGVDRVGGICGIGHYGNTVSGCGAEDVVVTATDPNATTVGLVVGATQGNASEPTIFVNNDTTGTTARIDNGDGTFTEVKKIYGSNIDGTEPVTNYVAVIAGVQYLTLADAVAAVEDGGTITLVANATFTESNRAFNSDSYYDGLYYIGDKSFTIDLGGFTIGQNGAVNDYLLNFKNDGEKANSITLKNGTLDAGTAAYCAICTSGTSTQTITINLENINVINNNSNGSTVKVRGGAVLNVKAGTVITGKNSYLGIECIASTVNIYDGAEIYMNGTSSYNGCLVGVGNNGTVNVEGGYGKGVSGGFIAMTSGGTINVSGGEWIANTDGTYANSNKSVLVAQSDKQNNAGAGNSVINVTGGTFKGGYNCYGNAVGDAQLVIAGGNFNHEVAETYLADGFLCEQIADGTYNVVRGLRGAGTESDPYCISTLDDLIFFRDSVNAGETKYNAPGVYVALTDNIDMASVDWSNNIGDNCEATFDGIFDGQNHIIMNLNATETAQSGDGYVCTGLFGAIYGSAVIKNLTIENVNINAGDFTGSNAAAVVGFAYSVTGSVENVNVIGDINIDAKNISGTGAIVGYDYYGKLTVKNCSVKGNDGSSINGAGFVGGIIGYASSNSNISNNTVENVDIKANGLVGGIAGIMLTSGKAIGNTVKNVDVAAANDNWKNSAAIVVGTVAGTGKITVSDTIFENVTANGETITAIVGSEYEENVTAPVLKVQARIGNDYYITLNAALTAAQPDETVTLLADIEQNATIEIPAGKTVVLDLNGNSIIGTDDATGSYSLITNKGNLTITDSVGTGKLTLKANNNRGWNAYSSVISNTVGGKLIVNGGTIEHLGGTDMAYGIDNLTNGKGTYAETVINGGTVKSPYRAIRQFLNGVEAQNILTVTGGTIEGTNRAIWMQDPSANANTGKLTVDANAEIKGDVYLSVTEGSKEWPVEVSVAAAALTEGKVVTSNVPVGIDVKNVNGIYSLYEVVASIGDETYRTLADAVAAAKADETITVVANVELTESLVIPADKVITLDLNGKTISQTKAQTEAYSMIQNRGDLTIKDSATDGKISYADTTTYTSDVNYVSNTIQNSGKLTVESGRIENLSESAGSYGFPHAIDNSGELIIEGGEVYNKNYSAIRIWCTEDTDTSVTIKGGTFTGAVDMHNVSAKPNKGTLTITGGTFNPGNGSGDGSKKSLRLVNFGTDVDELVMNVSGGTFNGGIAMAGTEKDEALLKAVLAVSGGSYVDQNVENYLAEGYALTYSNGMYTPVVDAVAKVGSKEYANLQDAINAAGDGDTVYVLKNIELMAPVTVAADKKITLDLMGSTVSYKTDVMNEALITNNGDLTITGNGTITFAYVGDPDTSYGKGNYTVVNGGKLTVENGTIANTTEKMSHAYYTIQNGGNGEVVINGGKIINETSYAIRQFASGNATNTVTINGGEVIGTRAVWMQAAGSDAANAPAITLNVNGGTLTSTGYTNGGYEYRDAVYSYSYGESLKNVAVNVTGGTVDGDILLTGGKNKAAVESVKITGGTINGTVESYALDTVAVPAIAITGGTFGSDFAEKYTTDDGYEFVKNADGTFRVEKTAVAQIGSQQFMSLQEAVTAANAGDVIELIGKAPDKFIIVDKPLTIEFIDGNTFPRNKVYCGVYVDPTTDEEIDLGPISMTDGIIVQQDTVSDADAGEAWAYVDIDNDGYKSETLLPLQAALDAAETAGGGTVKMIKDLTVNAIVVIPTGVTLDIEAHTLTVKSLIGVDGSNITAEVDAVKNDNKFDGGHLIVAKENLILDEDAYYNASKDRYIIPVWDVNTSSYVFGTMLIRDSENNRGLRYLTDADGNKYLELQFKHVTNTDINGIFKDEKGSDDNAVAFEMILTWTTDTGVAYEHFVYNADQVGKVAGKEAATYDFIFRLRNYEDMDNLTMYALVLTDCGVEVRGQEFRINE